MTKKRKKKPNYIVLGLLGIGVFFLMTKSDKPITRAIGGGGMQVLSLPTTPFSLGLDAFSKLSEQISQLQIPQPTFQMPDFNIPQFDIPQPAPVYGGGGGYTRAQRAATLSNLKDVGLIQRPTRLPSGVTIRPEFQMLTTPYVPSYFSQYVKSSW